MPDADDDRPFDPGRVAGTEHTHEAPDGTTLALTLFRPEDATAEDPTPVLLQRTPYGRPTDPPEGGFAALALSEGYAVAFEDTRGRGTSDGEFRPWVHEGSDGAATVEWLAARHWTDGVGMFGGSSPGQVQLFAAAERPEGLGAIAPTFTPSDLHRSDFFQDGAMSAMTFLTWSLADSVAGHTVDRLERRGRIDADTAEALRETLDDALERIPELAAHRPLVEVPDAVLGDVDLPGGLSPSDVVPHWEAWTSRPSYDEFWRSFDPEVSYDRIAVPGLHTTGWYELCQHGTVTNFAGLRDASPAPQHLVVGPWAHQNQGRTVGAVDFGPHASADAYGRSAGLLAFFDTYLRGEPTDPFAEPERSLVETFRASVVPHPDADVEEGRVPRPADTTSEGEGKGDGTEEETVGGDGKEDPEPEGASGEPAGCGSDSGDVNGDIDAGGAGPGRTGTGQWTGHADWPPADSRPEPWYLASEGDAAADPDDGVLSGDRPGKFEPADSWVHDPEDPVPTRGGPLCCRDATREPGMFERSDIQARPDVATYTTPAFDRPVELAGPVSLGLTAATTAPDTDFVAVLSHVTDDGRAYNLCEGVRRVRYRFGRDREVPAKPGEPFGLTVDMWNVHYEVPAGDRLRLEVASSNHPRFDPHPGTTDPWSATETEVRTAEQTVFHELDRESVLTVHRR